MSEPREQDLDAELAELLTAETWASTLRTFLNEAVSRQLMWFADDEFANQEELENTLEAMGEAVQEELKHTSLLDKGDEMQVRGEGALGITAVEVDDNGDSFLTGFDEIDITGTTWVNGRFLRLVIEDSVYRLRDDSDNDGDEDSDRDEDSEEAPVTEPLRITIVDVFIAIRDIVKKEAGLDDEPLGADMVALVDINDLTLRLVRMRRHAQTARDSTGSPD